MNVSVVGVCMIRKSVCCSLATMLALGATSMFAQANSTASSSISSPIKDTTPKPFTFPSKTHFLMAVDRQIVSRIQYQDVSELLGLEDMNVADEVTVYRGMRKAMLKHAAKKWDAGMAEYYGRQVDRMLGWRGQYNGSGEDIENRLMLFRYAQESKDASQVMKRYDEKLVAVLDEPEQQEAVELGKCDDELVSQADYGFYQHLGSSVKQEDQAIDLAILYESLEPCERFLVERRLDSHSHLSESVIEHSIIDVQSTPISHVLLSYSQDQR